jgi:mRNA-degrading endonuclease RelE of RelBE toxin-antitoxin system
MKRQARFNVNYAREVYNHLDFIERKYHRLIANMIKQQLTYTPDHRTRNRKPLEEPTTLRATWELRFGPDNSFRVYYEVNDSLHVVNILAIGSKVGNRVFIGGEEVES